MTARQRAQFAGFSRVACDARPVALMLWVVLITICVTPLARAAQLSFPLNGYFHPGRAIPVQWSNGTGNSQIEFAAAGAVTTRVTLPSADHGIFPFLILDRNAQIPSIPLHPLDDSEILIATTLDPAAVHQVFPTATAIANLDVQHPIEGPAMAWESLDGLVLSPESYAAIPDQTRDGLFSEGVTIAVPGDSPPDAILPWRHTGRWWISYCGIALPAIVNPDAYAPTLGWTAGRSSEFRRHIVLLAAVFCLAACGIGLWRSRWMPAALVLFSVIAVIAFAIDNRRLSPVAQAIGAMHLAGLPTDLQDTWLYSVSHRDTDFSVEIADWIHPVFFDADQMRESNLVLNCDAAGKPISLEGKLKADAPLALMRRRASMPGDPADWPITSQMRTAATPTLYPGFIAIGQWHDSAENPLRWPTVILLLQHQAG